MKPIHNINNPVNWTDLKVGDVVYKLVYDLREERLDLSTVKVIQIDKRECYDHLSVHLASTFSDRHRLDTFISKWYKGCIVGNKSNEGSVNYGICISNVLNSVNCSTKLYTDSIVSLEMASYKCLSTIDKLKTQVENHKYRGFTGFLYQAASDGQILTLGLDSTLGFIELNNHTYQSKLSKEIYYTTLWEAKIQNRIEKAEKFLNRYLTRIDELEKDKEHKIRLTEKLDNLKKQYGLQ